MLGAIIGDMVGSTYEWVNTKRKDFPFWSAHSHFTDDSVMTIAVADALMSIPVDADEKTVKNAVIKSMQKWAHKYPGAGYGGMFSQWLITVNPQPYNSWGNGSAMRTAAVGWLYPTLHRTLEVAQWVAEVSHNHPEGIQGAQFTAEVIYLARKHKVYHRAKRAIKEHMADTYTYKLNRTCKQIRPKYKYEPSCQKTVPEAFTAFFEGTDFEDVIRTAVSLGGDCDTLTCIAGSMAEAYYGIPAEISNEAYSRLPKDMRQVLHKFWKRVGIN